MARLARSLSVGVLAMALLVAGCGDDDGGGSAENLSEDSVTTSSAGGGTGTTTAAGAGGCKLEGATTEAATQQVVLDLNEFTIKPSIEPKAGVVTFVAENKGKEPHELVIVKGETAEGLPEGRRRRPRRGQAPRRRAHRRDRAVPRRPAVQGRLQPRGRQVRAAVQHRRDRAQRREGEPPQGRDAHALHGELSDCLRQRLPRAAGTSRLPRDGGRAVWLVEPVVGSRPPAGEDVMAHLVRADFGIAQLVAHGRLDGWFPALRPRPPGVPLQRAGPDVADGAGAGRHLRRRCPTPGP